MMPTEFTPTLNALCRERGVRAAAAVTADDGTLIDFVLRVGDDGQQVAALAASLYRKARLSARAAGLGEAAFLQLEAERGWVCAAGRDDLVVVTVAESRANVGLIRVEMLRSLEALP